jgi:hypothetical protein
MARAFVARAVLNLGTVKDLVERLRIDPRLRRVCGLTGAVPSEATFCRAFAELAKSGALDEAHERAVRAHLGETAVFHASHDSTAIPGREKTPRKPKEPKPQGPGRGGKRTKGRRPPPTVRESQEGLGWREGLALVPTACDYGVKIGSKGYPLHWRGYKAHASVADDGIPLAFFTTSASASDGNLAIPLVEATSERVGQVFYDLFDAGYQGEAIQRACRRLGHVPIVATKRTKKGEPKLPLTPDRLRRYAARSAVERFFSDLKENHGGAGVRVRGKPKVHAHLMCGALALFGLRLLRL